MDQLGFHLGEGGTGLQLKCSTSPNIQSLPSSKLPILLMVMECRVYVNEGKCGEAPNLLSFEVASSTVNLFWNVPREASEISPKDETLYGWPDHEVKSECVEMNIHLMKTL